MGEREWFTGVTYLCNRCEVIRHFKTERKAYKFAQNLLRKGRKITTYHR